MIVRDVKDVVEELKNQEKEGTVKGISVKDTAKELGVSARTVFRMIEDGRLQAKKLPLPFGVGYMWEVNPVSIAKLFLKKEAKKEMK